MKDYTTAFDKRQAGISRYVSAVKQAERILDVTMQSFEPACHIKRISKEMYLKGRYDREGNFLTDGEVHEVHRKDEPMRNRRSLKRIFKELRQKISHNFGGGLNELFVTLTYRGEEQTSDPTKVHSDFKAFWQRLKRAYAEEALSYIAIVEPHGSGKFHVHLLLRANASEHLYIPYERMTEIWGHGATQVERLESVDHLGAYFVAYFSNLELDPDEVEKYEAEGDVIEKNGKKYIKGKRLDFYPDGMQIARSSRDLQKPPKLVGSDAVRAIERGGRVRSVHTKEIESVDQYGRPKVATITTAQIDMREPF